MSTLTAPSRSEYPTHICRQGLWLFLLVLAAAAHAFWATGQLVQEYLQEGQFYGGFRLLGTPLKNVNHFLIHLDFGLLLVAIVWLAGVRKNWPSRAVLSPAYSDTRHRIVLGLILALAAFLLLWNLGGPLLWQDEAQSALISRTVVQTGLPRGTDGLNFFSQEQAAEYADGYLWRWHTWLPFYMVAGSFQLFGETTWAARFPSILLGWLTIPLAYRVAWEMWRDRRTALATAGLLSIHIGMILLSRQCRYYSALSLFTVISLWGYWRLLHQGRWGSTLLVAGMVGLFHTHYVYTGICGVAFLTHAGCFRRDRMRSLIVCACIVVALCLPWVIWFSQMKYATRYGHRTFHLQRTFDEFFLLVRHLSVDILPWSTWVVALIALRSNEKTSPSGSSQSPTEVSPGVLLSWLIAAHLVCLAPIIPMVFYRYLTPVIPLAMILAGRVLSLAYTQHPAIAGWAVVVFGLSSPLSDFVREQLIPVNSPMRGIVNYLRTHSSPDEVVIVSYGDLPAIFYLPNRIFGTLSGETLPPDADWVVVRSMYCGTPPEKAREVKKIVDQGDFERIQLDMPDMPFEHREDPYTRAFRTDYNFSPVTLYRRRSPAAQASPALRSSSEPGTSAR